MLYIDCISIKLSLAGVGGEGTNKGEAEMKDTGKEPQGHYLRFWVPELFI